MRFGSFGVTVLTVQLFTGCNGTEWTTFTAANEKFSLSMPSQPVRRVEAKDYPGGKIRIVGYISKLGKDAAFGITATEYPEFILQRLTVDQGLDVGVDAALKKYPTAASTVSNTTFKGNPARYFRIGDDTQKFVVEGNAYMISNRMYVLTAAHPPKQFAKETRRFFESFNVE